MEMMEIATFTSGCKMFWGLPEKDDCNICGVEKAEIAFRFDTITTYATRCRSCVKKFLEKQPDHIKVPGLKALEGL